MRGQNITTPSFRIIIDFVKYLFEISNYYVTAISTNEFTSKIVSETFTDFSEQQLSPRFKRICIITYNNTGLTDNDTRDRAAFIHVAQKFYPRSRTIEITYPSQSDSPQHLDLIKQNGHLFEELCIFNVPDYTTGSLLDYIVMYYSRSIKLIIRSGRTLVDYKKQETAVANHSLKSLFIEGYSLSPGLFYYISERFPCLETLKLNYHPYRIAKEHDSYLPMHMSRTLLQKLKIDFTARKKGENSTARFNRIYIKLVTKANLEIRFWSWTPVDDDVHYYGLHLLLEENAAEFDYNTSVFDKNCLTIFIHCASVEQFGVKYHGDDYDTKEMRHLQPGSQSI